jgi:glycosyltransferase involved in cell wall biosynthesis
MKIIKLYEHKANTGGIVNFQLDLEKYYEYSQNEYFYFRTGKVRNSRFLSNSLIRWFDLALSYLIFPFYLMIINPDLIEINTTLIRKSYYRDKMYFNIFNFLFSKRKTLLFIHGWNESFYDSIISMEKNKAVNYFNSYNSIIVLANSFSNRLKSIGVDQTQISVITTGIDLATFEKRKRIVSKIDSILFLSRMEEEKGIVDFINAIPLILNYDKNIIFNVAGDGSFLSEAKNHEISKTYSENINFHGYIKGEEKIKLLKSSTVYVFPSYHGEGCPVSVLEAMASELPIIYTNVGAMKELLLDGINGICIHPRDPKAIAKSVIDLITNRLVMKKIGEANKKMSKEKFDLRKIFSRIEDIYHNA